MFFSEINNLGIRGHRDIDFIDMNLATDIPLFLDPTLINELPIDWCEESKKIIDDYFNCIFIACKDKDEIKLMSLVRYGGEPNETKLGLSRGQSCGKGSTAEKLFKIFKSIADNNLIENGFVKNAQELCLFSKSFAEDRMSDLLTNLLRKKLYEFTVSKCSQHNIKINIEKQEIGRFWNEKIHNWDILNERPFQINDQNRLLVPKVIVRQQFIVSAGQYIQKQILLHRQAYHLRTRSDMVHEKYSKKRGIFYLPPTKKEIYTKEIKGKHLKEFAYEYTEMNRSVLDDFRRTRIKKTEIWNYVMTDTALDRIVYGTTSKQV